MEKTGTYKSKFSSYFFSSFSFSLCLGSTSISPVSESQVLETLAILTTGKFLLSRVLHVVWNHVENTLMSSTERCCLYLSCVLKVNKMIVSYICSVCDSVLLIFTLLILRNLLKSNHRARIDIYPLLPLKQIIRNTISNTECLNYILEDWSGLLKVISLCVKAIVSQEIKNPVPALQHLSSVCRVIVAKMGQVYLFFYPFSISCSHILYMSVVRK